VSSGKTNRLRLNRGGDRQANAALYHTALSRLRWDPQTRADLARRIAQGKTRREALRRLKRSIARELYQIITQPTPHPTTLAIHRGIKRASRRWLLGRRQRWSSSWAVD
jgi:transposase